MQNAMIRIIRSAYAAGMEQRGADKKKGLERGLEGMGKIS
jgi:hypothetical protein